MMYNLDTPVKELSKIGQVTASRLKRLGIEKVRDLLFYFPFRYDDFSAVYKIEELKPGVVASVSGRIDLIHNKRSPVKRKIITEAMFSDDTGTIKVIWFNQPFLIKTLRIGDNVFLSGKVDYDLYGIQMTSPSYEKMSFLKETIHTGRVVPVYSITENLTQKQIRALIKIIISLADKIDDWMPPHIINKYNFISISRALNEIHFPSSDEAVKKAKKRLKFDELFLIQLESQILKYNLKQKKSISIEFKQEPVVDFVKNLPFKLTDSQRKATWEILKNLEKPNPMNRLLEGDVGSGKTIVAAIAMYNTALNKYQAVIMAPTEILARQHFDGFCKLFLDANVNIGLMTRTERLVKLNTSPSPPLAGGERGEELVLYAPINKKGDKTLVPPLNKGGQRGVKITKPKIIKLIKDGEIDIIIGTHALLQEKVEFKNLVFSIIDEQHRFGVEQRKTLREKSGDTNTMPHFLSMTATPIPRSLALTMYGDLDLSILDQMPSGRKKIITKVVESGNRGKAYDFIREQIQSGRQAFVICPLIDPSDKMGYKSVSEEYKKLNEQIFKDLKIGILHGKLKSKEKEEVMASFIKNEINVLVSTSVVEVGVDIPNATVMMIEGADHFGLAQLHQFRGRVGRSDYQSYCLLFSESVGQNSLERLFAMEKSNNGFELAEKDLQIRGPGQVYGVQQSGIPDLKIAKLGDYGTIKQSKEEAEQIMAEDSSLDKWPILREKINKCVQKVHLE